MLKLYVIDLFVKLNIKIIKLRAECRLDSRCKIYVLVSQFYVIILLKDFKKGKV